MGSIVGSVLGTVGGLLGGSSASSAADAAAEANRQAGIQARQDALFRPVGLTTNFGTSAFEFDPTGKLSGASYTLDPRLQAAQNQLWGQLGSYDPTQIAQAAQPLYGAAGGLFNLGQSYIAQNPQDVAQKWMTQQQNLLAPSREQELASVQNQQYQTGRAGLGVGGTTQGYTGVGSPGLMSTNPQIQALYNARAQQDAQLASQAQLQGQQQQQFGAGLFSTGASLLGQVPNLTTAGYSPLAQQLNLLNTTESMGQAPLTLGASLGSSAANAGAQAGRLNMAGVQAATPYQYQSDAYNPWATALQGAGSALGGSGGGQLGNWFSTMLNSNNTASPFYNSGLSNKYMLSGAYMGGSDSGE